MKVRSLALALMVLALGVVARPYNSRAQSGPFVPHAFTWSVDDQARTITVTVQLAFYPACPAGTSCVVQNADVQRITAGIERYWNTGQKVRCYTLAVKVLGTVVASQDQVGPDAVDVRLDYSPAAVRGFVNSQSGSGDPLGDTPTDRVDPLHNPARPTTWSADTWDAVYAHEFGHILGLHDNYDPANPRFPLPGTSDDLMFRNQGDVTAEMVERVVRRSGQVDVDKLACDFKVDYRHANGWTLTGKKCDRPEGEWTLTMGGSGSGISWSGKMTFTLYAPRLSGQIGGNWHGDVGAGTSDGTWTGTARFVDGKPPKILIPSQSPGQVCVPGFGCRRGTGFGKVTLVLQVGKFC